MVSVRKQHFQCQKVSKWQSNTAVYRLIESDLVWFDQVQIIDVPGLGAVYLWPNRSITNLAQYMCVHASVLLNRDHFRQFTVCSCNNSISQQTVSNHTQLSHNYTETQHYYYMCLTYIFNTVQTNNDNKC